MVGMASHRRMDRKRATGVESVVSHLGVAVGCQNQGHCGRLERRLLPESGTLRPLGGRCGRDLGG